MSPNHAHGFGQGGPKAGNGLATQKLFPELGFLATADNASDAKAPGARNTKHMADVLFQVTLAVCKNSLPENLPKPSGTFWNTEKTRFRHAKSTQTDMHEASTPGTSPETWNLVCANNNRHTVLGTKNLPRDTISCTKTISEASQAPETLRKRLFGGSGAARELHPCMYVGFACPESFRKRFRKASGTFGNTGNADFDMQGIFATSF